MASFLVVHPNLDIYGGGEKVCNYIIKALASHGQKVEMLTFDFDVERFEAIMGEPLPANVSVHSIGKRLEVKPPFTVYKRRRKIIQLLKEHKDKIEYDYLFSTQSFSPFEATLLGKTKKNIAYVHFPEIHYDYDHAGLTRKIYLWSFKKGVEKGIKNLDMIFCNSNYTKGMIERYWKPLGSPEPIVIYPPVDLEDFWCKKPLEQRPKRVCYVGRFIPQKRHEILKQLAQDLPEYEFVSVGGLRDTEESWFKEFSQNLPKNYTVKPNAPKPELVQTVQDSRVYVHLMEGEHFGIAPMEALAGGCITLIHNSGGAGEFIPEPFRWNNYEDLKTKIRQFMQADESFGWESQREKLWEKLATLAPKNFEDQIWANLQNIMAPT